MPKKIRSVRSRKGIKENWQREININLQKELKELGRGQRKRSFSEIERLIKLARQTSNKTALQRWKKTYRQKELTWGQGLLKGQRTLRTRHQERREKKEFQALKEQSHQQRQERLKTIYAYFQKELFKQDKQQKLATGYFTLKKEFIHDKTHQVLKLNKAGSNYLLKKTSKAYHEEIQEKNSQIRYWQENAGLTKIQADTIVKKGQKIKLFFPEKGEHKDFWARNKEFKQLLAEILQRKKGTIKGREKISKLSQQLYQASPRRIRDRWPILVKQPASKSFGLGEVYDKFVKNNHDPHTHKHYKKAIINLSVHTARRGELVPDNEIDLDKYGKPLFKEGQVIVVDNRTG